MKVSQLIDKLKGLDPDMDIMISSEDNHMDGYYHIEPSLNTVTYKETKRVILTPDYKRKKRRI